MVDMRNGIDVSPWQHPRGESIDWATVAGAGYRWMADKINEGLGDSYAVDWPDFPAAHAVDVETVAYHFARPNDCGPAESALKFAQLCDQHAPGSRRCLDLEDGYQLGWDALAEWARIFREQSGADILYVNRNYRDGLLSVGPLDAWDLWLAYPGHPWLDDQLYAVQFGQGAVPGVPSTVDLNLVTDLPLPPPGPPAPTPEVRNVDEQAIFDLYVKMYAEHGNDDVAGRYDNFTATIRLPREQWAGHVADVAHSLAHPS